MLAHGRQHVPLTPEQVRAARADLREFLRLADEIGCLRVIRGANPELEIGALHELSLEKDPPPALLFDDIVGYPRGYRVLANVQESAVFNREKGLAAVQAARLSGRTRSALVEPTEVTSGPVLENVLRDDEVNTLRFPTPRWHADDGGRYIGTQCVVITRDPDSSWVNLGTYRAMLQDERTVSVFIEPGKHGDIIRRKYWERGDPCPMALSVGQAPALSSAGARAAGPGESEYAMAGSLAGRPVPVVRGLATGLPIPAEAEIVFEGFMCAPEVETRLEGPFGEWPGYYTSGAHPEPVLRIAAMYHRNDPILTGAPPVKPTYPGKVSAQAPRAAAVWDALEAAGVPGIKGVWKMQGGGARFITVIAVDQQHAGHAKMAGLVATGCGADAYLGRLTIVVDDDIDITNPAEVMWALATRWDPKTGTDVIDGCWTGYIDPTLEPSRRDAQDLTNTRAILYAVRPYHWRAQFPKPIQIDPAYAAAVREKWAPLMDFLGG